MSSVNELYNRMIEAMGVEGLNIPATCVRFYKQEDEIPENIMAYHPDDVSITSCQSTRQASLGDAVCVSKKNIGCVAAAISLGLVDQHDKNPLEGPRVYTEIMRSHQQEKEAFNPPTPDDFTEGRVYACKDAEKPEFCLFEDDSGRYDSVETAKKAIADMMAIQPAVMKAVFFYAPFFEEIEGDPDIVVLSVRPVELTRIVQAYQFHTGKRVTASIGGVRVVNSDLIARPYLTQEMNISTYCLGARLIAQYEANRLGIGIPFNIFRDMVQGMEDSQKGFPFSEYPGALEWSG